MQRAEQRLMLVVPITLLLIMLITYLNEQSMLKTASVIGAGLLPIMWSTGAGADVMKRIAVPMIGGVVTDFAFGLLVYPAIYFLWRGWGLSAKHD